MQPRIFINLVSISLLLTLAGVMSVIWHGEHSPHILQAAISGFMPIPDAASGMASPPAQYFYFGRFTLLFYVAIFLNIIRIKQSISPRIVHISLLLLSIAFIGDIATYWLSDIYGTYFRTLAFWYTEFPALVLVLTYWFSLASYQSIKSRKPHPMIWVLPLAIVATGGIQYLPHSFLIVILIVVSFKHFTQRSN